ncbi:MAG: inositol 2-dehydrogenase [Hyphomicrobiaceae bacterium]
MLKIAVLGCGRIGQMHARNIANHPRARLAAVYDINELAANKVASEWDVPVQHSAHDVFESSDVDAVLIASSTDTHCDFLEMGVAANKSVLCEKPIDLSLERVNRCAAKIANSNVPIMIGFVRRFDPSHRATRNAIAEGQIGELRQVIITSRDPGMAPDAYMESSGGIFRDMTIHDFDMARYILAEEPIEVAALGSRLVDPTLMQRLDDYDTLSVTLKTASGKQCLISNSRQASYGYDQRVEALGSTGMVQSENIRAHHSVISGSNFTAKAGPFLDFFIERYSEAFDAEITAFVDAVENGTAPEVSFEDGRQALRLAEAAVKSVKERRSVDVNEVG